MASQSWEVSNSGGRSIRIGAVRVFGRLAVIASALSALLIVAGCVGPPRRDVLPNLIIMPCRDYQRPLQLVWRKEPEYTDEDLKLGGIREVAIEVTVGTDGRVLKAKAHPNVGNVGKVFLIEAALKAARQCVFDPACSDGHAVPASCLIIYKFPPDPPPLKQRRR